jgi:hypothetical protein
MDNQYEVVHPFRDLQDKKKSFPNGRVYNVGDSFPATREMDKQLTPERLEELSSNKNKIGKVLIKKVGE